jgi:enoyl-CoA hydratase/carnithine racemase
VLTIYFCAAATELTMTVTGGLMAFTQFVVTQHSKTYWRITFGNPPINLVNPETVLELQSIVNKLEADPEVQVAVFDSAHPDFFFARYDLRRAAETPVAPGPSGLPTWIDLTTRLSQLSVISIASIRGRTRGGEASLHWPVTCASPAEKRPSLVSQKCLLECFPVVARLSVFHC